MIKKRLGARPLPVQLPIGSEENFKGMVDLVEMKALVWDSDDKDAEWQSLDITPDLADKLHITTPSDRKILADVAKYRTELVDTCLEQDDEAMEAYLTHGTVPSADVLRKALRKGTLHSAFTLVLCGSSYKNKGVQQVLDAVVDYLPAPTDVAVHQDRGRRRRAHRRAQVLGRRAVLGAGVQGHQRRLWRAHLHPRLFRRADQGRLGAELHPRQAREDRPHGRDVRQGSQSGRRSPRRRHHRPGLAGGYRDRRHAVRRRQSGGARAHALPGPGHQRVGQVEGQGRAGEVRHRARQDGPRRSLAASGDRPRNRPDHSARHGRAASGGDAGPHAHRIRRRRHHGRAAGGLSRDHHQEDRRTVHPQEADRRFGPVRRSVDHLRAAASAAPASSSSTRPSAARCRGNSCPRSRRA